MARAKFVKKARKDNPAVKAGESYYWWKFRFGGKIYSKTAPARSQLTQSDFLGSIYDIEDGIHERFAMDSEDITTELVEAIANELADELTQLGEEQEEKRENMPEQLQDSDSGQMLEERASGLEEWSNSIQGINFSDIDDEQDKEDALEEIICEIDGANPGTW